MQVDGQRFYGWKQPSITRTMESLVNRFDVRAADIESDRRMKAIVAGASCEFYIDDDLLLTGFIQDVLPDYDATKHERVFIGESVHVDLVESNTAGQQFRNQTLLQVANSLTKPFGINVTANVDVGPAFKYLLIDTGQAIGEFLEYAARMRGCRFLPTDDGHLVIDQVGTVVTGTTLALGNNILRGRPRFSGRDVFSDYTVISDQPQLETINSADTAHAKGSAKNPTVRYRPMHILSEFPADIEQCNAQALWHSKLAFARSQSFQYTVKGWRDDAGKLWTPNTLVMVQDRFAPLNERMLIVEAMMTVSAEQGRVTELLLMKPDALKQQVIPEPTEDTGGTLAP